MNAQHIEKVKCFFSRTSQTDSVKKTLYKSAAVKGPASLSQDGHRAVQGWGIPCLVTHEPRITVRPCQTFQKSSRWAPDRARRPDASQAIVSAWPSLTVNKRPGVKGLPCQGLRVHSDSGPERSEGHPRQGQGAHADFKDSGHAQNAASCSQQKQIVP